MTVAPELPPALDRRPAGTGRPTRAARRRPAAAHPTGAVAARPGPVGDAATRPGPVGDAATRPGSVGDAATGSGSVGHAAHVAPAPVWGPARRGATHLRVATRSSAPVESPVEILPGPRLPSRVDLDPAAPAPAAPRQRALVELHPGPGAGSAGRPPPAVPGRLRVTGTRVVRPARPPLRLTVRGRLLVALLAGLAIVMGALAVTARVEALREPASPVPASAPAAVVVAPGESLWTIAERVAPDRDPRVVVDQLRRLNQLPTTDVRAGQRILLRAP